MSSRLVSIGLPVYNGGECLRRALDSILAQTHANFEVIISDNASTDGVTPVIAEEYAQRDSRIRLIRQTVNQGALANFLWVAQQARGDYFMWAAHDDAWSENFVEALANRLDESPQAVLATPRTRVEKITKAGTTQLTVFPEAPHSDRWAILDAFLVDYGCVWIYGLYRTEWLKLAAPKLTGYQIIGADRLWLLDLILNNSVTSTPEALFYYSYIDGKPKDRSSRTKLRDLGIEIYYMSRSALQQPNASDRVRALRKILWFLYWHRISRRNPIGTLIRIVKLSVLGTWFGLESGIRYLTRPRRLAN